MAILRRKAVESIIRHGMSLRPASIVFSFLRTLIWEYIKVYRDKKEKSFVYKKRGVEAGTGSKISKEKEDQLVRNIFSYTPDELGMNYTL